MKYISLLHVMRLYGHLIKVYRSVRCLDHSTTNRPYTANGDYRPFTIGPRTDMETGQLLNTLRFNLLSNTNGLYGYNTSQLGYVVMPPVMEVEWLKTELGLDHELTEVLNQLAYLFTVQILIYGHDMDTVTTTTWMENLERENCIIDVEDLMDTPTILSSNSISLPAVSLTKIRSWQTAILYDTTFPDLFERCVAQATSFKELYYHMPVLLTLFMRDYCVAKLKNWPKQIRLEMKNTIQDSLNRLDRYSIIANPVYTYGLCGSVTETDVNFIRTMLGMVQNKIQDLNSDIGIISFSDYQRIQGPETIRAIIRLSNMDIDWSNEISRAKREKERQENSQDSF